MCGIAGIYIKDPDVIKSHRGLESFVNDLLLGIEHRGHKATGFVAVAESGEVRIDKAPVTASEFIKEREPLPEGARTILLHTRLDTKGSPNDSRNNHPVIHKTCFVVHNGWVRNDDELFAEGNFERIAEVDSEVIAAMLYEADFDTDKVKNAFDKMEGAIACAAIDPIRHPGRLLLARVEHSPLEFVDTPKFLVWASEKKAIREAWGKHIGTPPKDKKISSLDRLTMLVVTPEGVETVKIPFTAKGWTGGEYTYLGGTPPFGARGTMGGQNSTRNSTRSATATQVTNGSQLVLSAEIKQVCLTKCGKGEGKARTWEEKGKHPLAIGIGPWLLCELCERRLHKDDLRDSLRGKICCDCHAVWMELSAERRNAMAEADRDKPWAISNNDDIEAMDEQVYREVNALFNLRVRNRFSAWCDDEDFVHNMVITDIAKGTGFSEQAVEYLLFRTTSYHEQDIEGLAEWKQELLTLYDEKYGEMWDFYDPDSYADATGMEILADRTPTPRAQQRALPPGTDEGGGTYKVPTFRVLFDHFRFAKSKGRCRFCNRHTKSVVARSETTELLEYCNRHFATCGVEKCKNAANHTREDGIRVCHSHARGMKSCHADTFLKSEGYHIGKESNKEYDAAVAEGA